jgi:hypothetical protein
LTLVVAVIAILLAVTAPAALAWKEGPGTNWWYVDASYGGWHNSVPLVIEIDGDPPAGQTFNVGDTITISCDLHSYAAMCAGWGNEALTDAALDVSGPTGSGSDTAGDYDFNNDECAEVETIKTLTINYLLTAAGTHTVYMYSYAEAASWWAGVDEDDFVEDSLTFEVVLPPLEVDIDIKPGSDPNCFNSNSHGVIPVAILGSADFDASTVDPFTVSLDSAGVRVKGESGKAGSLEDVNADGFQDLVVQITDEGGYTSGDTTAILEGYTYDGLPIVGTDTICIVPPE